MPTRICMYLKRNNLTVDVAVVAVMQNKKHKDAGRPNIPKRAAEDERSTQRMRKKDDMTRTSVWMTDEENKEQIAIMKTIMKKEETACCGD